VTELRALTMPKWGIEMTEGTLSEWKVRAGERITRGQLIAVIETEKIANDVEAEFDSVVASIVAEAGETYPVGALLAVLASEAAAESEIEAFVRDFRPAEGSAAATAMPAAAVSTPAGAAAPTPAGTQASGVIRVPSHVAISPAARALAERLGLDPTGLVGSGRRGRITLQDVAQAARPAAPAAPRPAVSIEPGADEFEHVFASPYARRLARVHAVDLAGLHGTGRHGRIGRRDVMNVAALRGPAVSQTGAAGAPAQIVRMSPMRKAIARQLALSKSTIPHFYLRNVVRVDPLLAARARDKQASGSAPSLNDYFLRAAALALIEVPDVNVQVHEDAIHRFAHADVAFAVATDGGLITPIIRAADTKTVSAIAAETRALAERARAGKLKAEEFQGGSFCLSNLGMYGIDQFDAIINPPQAAILAIGAARTQPVEQNHALSFATVVSLSLSCDHRAIDGAVGATFMARLRELIENPGRLMA
jgi:pyruvate dehydrogenase E2 component (dihydrolipoamide acetyltransferase)